jgi:hypothetical protein
VRCWLSFIALKLEPNTMCLPYLCESASTPGVDFLHALDLGMLAEEIWLKTWLSRFMRIAPVAL